MKETDLLMSKAAFIRELNSGVFPPHVCYKILYRLSKKRRLMPTFLKVDLYGADVPLTFSCRFYEAGECPASYLSYLSLVCVYSKLIH